MKKLLVITGICVSMLANAQVQFTKFNTLEAMLKAAQDQGKCIFIDGYTDWCGWCKVLDSEVFGDKTFADTLHKYFVPVKLEMEKDSLGVIIARKYAIRGFPNILIINGQGRLVTILNGYSPLDDYTKRLREAIDKVKNKAVVTGHTSDYNLPYPKFYLKTFPMPGKKREKQDSVEVNNYLNNQKDWNNELVWLVLKTNYYSLNALNQERYKTLLPDLAKSFGESEAEELYIRMVDKHINRLMNSNELEFVQLLEEITRNLRDRWWYLFHYKMEYYKNKKDYNKLTELVEEFVNSTHPKNNVDPINEVAWELYQTCNDTLLLNQAIGWMQRCVLVKKPTYNYFDTYAALLYKTGRLEEARVQAKFAIKIGKADGEKTAETEKLLTGIEQALANRK